MNGDFISREKALQINLNIKVDAVPAKSSRAVLKACEAGAEAGVDAYADYIRSIPAEDVRAVVRAEWVECDWCVPSHGFVEHYKNAAWKCSACRHAFKKQNLFVKNYCPNCGADMRGETQAFDKDINVTIKTDKEEGPE